jgi:hypothetical protein
MSLQFRDLRAEEIDVRIGMCKENGVSLLLYKDARCDMNILDETVGAENWEREHYECKGNLFCRVGINRNFDKPNEFRDMIYKSDCGTESNTEKEKGESSDSFKRACVNFGIGRCLYTSPFIWAKAEDCNIKASEYQGKKRYTCSDNFIVEKIVIENKRITAIAIKNASTNKRVFVWQEQKK